MKILIATHGKMASGIKSSVDILLGNSDQIYTIDGYIDEKNIETQIEEFFKEVKGGEQIVLMSDIYGGSVSQILFKYIQRNDVYLIAGINLGLVLEVALSADEIDANLLDKAIADARCSMIRVEDKEMTEEEFF